MEGELEKRGGRGPKHAPPIQSPPRPPPKGERRRSNWQVDKGVLKKHAEVHATKLGITYTPGWGAHLACRLALTPHTTPGDPVTLGRGTKTPKCVTNAKSDLTCPPIALVSPPTNTVKTLNRVAGWTRVQKERNL